MPQFKKLLQEKNQRLIDVPLALQNVVEKQQKKVLSNIISQLSKLETTDGKINPTSKNLDAISKITDELKSIFINPEYLNGIKEFVKEFDSQAELNEKIISLSYGK